MTDLRKNQLMYLAFANRYGVGDMTSGMWVRAANIYADLRRKSFTVGDADILIAAFCLVNGYILVTNNTKDFENVDGLQLVNWAE